LIWAIMSAAVACALSSFSLYYSENEQSLHPRKYFLSQTILTLNASPILIISYKHGA
jgi:hypothetical protein